MSDDDGDDNGEFARSVRLQFMKAGWLVQVALSRTGGCCEMSASNLLPDPTIHAVRRYYADHPRIVTQADAGRFVVAMMHELAAKCGVDLDEP